MAKAHAIGIAWIAPDDPRMAAVHDLRHDALMAPFGVERLDFDDAAMPESSVVVATLDGAVVGTACLITDPSSAAAHVRLVAVAHSTRESGVGRTLMLAAEEEARARGFDRLWLHARVSAEGFYHRLGYVTVSEQFSSGRTSLPHVRMERHLR